MATKGHRPSCGTASLRATVYPSYGEPLIESVLERDWTCLAVLRPGGTLVLLQLSDSPVRGIGCVCLRHAQVTAINWEGLCALSACFTGRRGCVMRICRLQWLLPKGSGRNLFPSSKLAFFLGMYGDALASPDNPPRIGTRYTWGSRCTSS